jgi:hypothetical protein
MPGDEHNFAIGDIIECFDEWKNGRMIKCRTKVNVYVNDSFNRPPNAKRCPHFAIFGPDRLIGRGIRTVNGKPMNPHVVIQFSWSNNFAYKALAVDDMMNFAGVGE